MGVRKVVEAMGWEIRRQGHPWIGRSGSCPCLEDPVVSDQRTCMASRQPARFD